VAVTAGRTVAAYVAVTIAPDGAATVTVIVAWPPVGSVEYS
jgi:hypothetical protein